MNPILVTGGTGVLGRQVVQRLRDAGHEVRVLTRQTGLEEDGIEFVTGDLVSSDNVDLAVEGVETIIHSAGSQKGDEVATQNLVNAAIRSGWPHIVYISVSGADRVPMTGRLDRMMFSYFAMKRDSEEIVARSGLPWTTLRATQFHDLMLKVVTAMAKLPIIPVPTGIRFQPVDSDAVARRMVELALGQPAGLVQEMGGPEVYEMKDMLRSYLAATNRRRLLLPLHLPGNAARAVRDGANLSPGNEAGGATWEEFLRGRLHEGSSPHHAASAAMS